MADISTQDILTIARRHLPHWEQGGSTYFLTWRSQIGTMPEECLEIVKRRVLSGHGVWFSLHVGVVMPDHVHLILQPLAKDPPAIGQSTTYVPLHQIVKGIKGASAREINRFLQCSGSVWQDERWDRILRNEAEYLEKYRYILYNPVKAGLVQPFEDYKFYIFPPEVEKERHRLLSARDRK